MEGLRKPWPPLPDVVKAPVTAATPCREAVVRRGRLGRDVIHEGRRMAKLKLIAVVFAASAASAAAHGEDSSGGLVARS
jgi:hypothetical protein